MIDNQMQQFQHEEFGSIRTITIDGEPWFVGRDATAALGYANANQALKTNVEDEDKGIHSVDTLGGKQQLTIINESGLYSLILSSRLTSAKKFKRWVTSEILPSIRKTGGYTMENHPFTTPEGVSVLCQHYLLLDETNRQLSAQVEEFAPKARYYDLILQSRNTVQTSVIAKDYGLSAVAFNRLLHDLRIQYRMGGANGIWLLYQEYADQGYTKTRTYQASERTSVIHTYWTQKGRLFLYEKLKQEGILPTMEADDPADFDPGGGCP